MKVDMNRQYSYQTRNGLPVVLSMAPGRRVGKYVIKGYVLLASSSGKYTRHILSHWSSEGENEPPYTGPWDLVEVAGLEVNEGGRVIEI